MYCVDCGGAEPAVKFHQNLFSLRRVLHGQTQLAQVAAELFDALVVALDGVRRKLRQLVGDALRLRHLPRPAHNKVFYSCNLFYCLTKVFYILY